jgi:hypothetical protein
MKNFLFSLLFLLGAASLQAQTYGWVFQNPTVLPNDKFQVTIAVQAAGGTFYLGSHNLAFNYNFAALGAPVIVGNALELLAGTPFGAYTFSGQNATTGVGRMSVSYNGSPTGNFVPVGATPVPIITVEFPITAATSTNLVWRQNTTAFTNPKTTTNNQANVVVTTNAASFINLSNGSAITYATAGTTTTTYLVPLPIGLTSFTAVENAKVNDIAWETSFEQNIRNFVIEKSSNGTEWSKLGEVLPNTSRRYRMTDNAPSKTTYYRLRSNENDGRSELSPIVVVNRKSKDNGINITVQPNPVVSNAKVTFSAPVKNTVNTTIMNVNGQIVQNQATVILAKDGDLSTFDVEMGDLPAGTYFIRVDTGSEELVEKVVKL